MHWRFIVSSSKDCVFEVTGNWISLRPSDILYSRTDVSFVANENDGVRETLADIFNHVLRRTYSPNDVAGYITVVRREDRRGTNFKQKTYESERNGAGWWCVKGNGYLWVLKSLENLGVARAVKVKCMRGISEEYWEDMWSDIRIEKERTDSMVPINGRQLQIEVRDIIRDYRKYIKPEWNFVRTQTQGTNRMRLEDYEPCTTTARNTRSCAGKGICFGPVYDLGEDPNTDVNHRCQRPFESMICRKNPKHSPTFIEIFEGRLYLCYFLLILFVSLVGNCFLKGCAKVIENMEAEAVT